MLFDKDDKKKKSAVANHLLAAETHHFGLGWNGIGNIIAILLSTLTKSQYLAVCWTDYKFLRDISKPIPYQRVLHRLVLVLKVHVLVNVFRRLRRVYAYAYAYNTCDPTNQEPSAYCWLKVGHSDTHVTVPELQKIVWAP